MGKGANHMRLDGQTVLADEKFDLKDGHTAPAPGMSGVAGHDINCRCIVVREVMDDAEFFAKTGRHLTGWEELKKSAKTVENDGKDDIIEANEVMRRKGSDYIEPMPKKQLHKIMKGFKRNGGSIVMGDEVDAYLASRNAEAITYDATLIMLKRRSGRAAVFEELIHTTQFRNGKNDGTRMARLSCEIEAQEKLLKYKKAYRLTDAEVRQTESALKAYKKELDDFLKGDE